MKLWYFHPLNWRLAFQSIKWKYDRKVEIAYRNRMLDSMKRWEDLDNE